MRRQITLADWARRARMTASGLRLLFDRGHWLEPDRVLACTYPFREGLLRGLTERGISVLVNLHERPHDPRRLARHGLAEIHLPVVDFTAPSPETLARGVQAIEQAVAGGKRVAVHCGAGLGRTGTLLACYLVRRGLGPAEAIAQIRRLRPGSVETPEQEAAVRAYWQATRATDDAPGSPGR